jgi:hypothetical protein
LLRGIISRCLWATWCLASTGAGLAAAQEQPPAADPLASLLGEPRADRPLTPAEAMEAYVRVAEAVETWQAPERRADLAAPAAARVALYRAGRLVGAANAIGGVGGDPDVLGRAAEGAMEAARLELLPRQDALWREQMRALAGDLTVSVELAGPLTPLGEAEVADPDSALRPGLDGLGVRVGKELVVVFPSELVAGEATPRVELAARAARLLGDPSLGVALPHDLAKEHGAVFYRFGVVHIAGVGEAGSPEFLVRGGRVVEPGEVSVASLVRFAEELLAHFEAARHPAASGLGLMGTIHPSRGVADPAVASPTQQAIVALALLGMAETPQLSEAARARAAELARELMLDLQRVEEGEVEAERDGVAAAVAWVVLERLGAGVSADDALGPLWGICERMLADHAQAERGEPRGAVSEAVLAWAMAERARATGRDRGAAERDVRALYRAVEPGGLVGLMPWLGWAELALAPEGPVPAGPALRQVREQVWEHQLGGEDAGSDGRDLAGGIVFTRGFVALPSAASARPVALCATMLRDPRLTPAAEAPGEIVRLLGAMRFLDQLGAGEVECRFYANPALARGAVRAAVWDHRMAPETSAAAALCVSEFLRSLAALEAADALPAR